MKSDDFKIVLVSRDWVEGERTLRILEAMGFKGRTKWFREFDKAKGSLSENTLLFVDIDPHFLLPDESLRWQKEWADAGVTAVVIAPFGGAGRLPEGVELLRKPVDFRELEQVFRRLTAECNIAETISLRQKIETQYLQIRHLEGINRQIVDSIPLAVAVLDADMRVVYANRSFYQMLELPEGTDVEIGSLFTDSLAEAQKVLDDFEEVLKTGMSVRTMQHAFTPSVQSKQKFLDIWMSRLPTEPRQVLLVMDDVTQFISQRSTLQMLKKVAVDIRGTLDLERVLFTILTCVTAGVAIGFTRAFLFLVDEEEGVLRGRMGVGPMTTEEAQRIWGDLSLRERNLEELIAAYDLLKEPDKVLHLRESEQLVFSLSDREHLPVAALDERRTFIVTPSQKPRRARVELLDFLGTDEFVVVPLLTARRPLGVVVADNRFSNRPITSEQIELLETFSSQASIAIETADAYRQLQEKVEQLQKAYHQLEEAQRKMIQVEQLAAVGRMAAKVAHEIRNPLVTIGGFARMIRKNPDDAMKVRSNSYVIVEEVKRLERILSELMDLSRPSPPVLEMFNINRLVDEIALKEKENLQQKGIELQVETDESIGEIMIDSDKIRQAILNLIRNAQNALEEVASVPEKELKVFIRTENKGDTVCIHIEDTGTGIPEELQPHIFQPFFTTRSSGTGLGLAIAKRIIDEHHGRLTFTSEYGRGTHFTIRLPRHHR